MATATERITRDDIETKLREVAGDVDDKVEAARPKLLLGAVGGAVLLVLVADPLGRRGGKKRSAVVEIRRPVIDGLLRRLAPRAWRMGTDGQPVWLAVAGAVWLVRRSRRRGPPLVWSGKLQPGDRLLLTSRGPGAAPASDEA